MLFRMAGQWLVFAAVAVASCGCTFGPKALESSHRQYNDAVKQVTEEQLLLNLVRVRYNDNPERLDVSAIATQYELQASAEARPFFSTQAARIDNPTSIYGTFTSILPFAGLTGSTRPTISLTPLDDPATIKGMFAPSTLDGIIFLTETSWPVATVFRLWVEYLNGIPNAPEASGPSRGIVPRFRAFQAIVQLLQVLHDRGDARFVREEKISELGSPLPEASVTATAHVEAAKNGYEYRRRADKTWILVKRDYRLVLTLNPSALASPEVESLCRLLHLRPGQLSYEVTVGGPEHAFAWQDPAPAGTTINIVPRSLVQAYFYMAHGIRVPVEHFRCGIVRPTLEADGTLFDWEQLTGGLFAVHSVKQLCRPKYANVAVRYRDYWFYVDDRDADSKATFALMAVMTRSNLLGARKGGPSLTLPVGR